MKLCHKCGLEWPGPGQPQPKAECVKCGYDLHVCLNCRFYDTSKPNQCSAGVDEVVLDKEKANYCDEFEFIQRKNAVSGGSGEPSPKAAWDKLFKSK
ncbi:MAG TPA: hypothetical protein DEE98_07100 [Elusimicrobia bacterium]|nr:MAG: hypothetical protein A2278_00265 [Elusimicrobia bacterium RIFOXYA12_FULL_49_49]OGS06552.1 MAG: hypothetical protein A2204_03020 [Elusimicrobia bacterium RIFOXYA1_FULL_47_7]OGS15866.1 MAG: hypothetical protein A2251_04400 [Elusimicrobia bacterium RIFOXYA2_FULL_47_53]OGS27160.1 MAG: hypothetical protein A2339_00650 [Elusimicrobia bacterium RIFOXYB12_FULL_50_12]OGS31199.1 MAG: hypothetical protein A2323_09120 [Elusimicrobia bacterium RIFOXYB2_FULL_46_23]HBU70132.1 hypothetical protein [El